MRCACHKPRLFLLLASVWLVGSCRGFAQSNSDFDRGMAEFRVGNYASAADLLAKAEAETPGTTDALLYRAKSLVHIEKFSDAEDGLRRYIASHHDSSDALYMLGFVLNRQNRAADSLAAYTQAASITQPTGDDLKIVGLDYVLLDDYPDAIKWLEKSVALDSANEDAWYYLGRAYYTKAQLTEARRAFQKVLELNPRNAKAENNLGLILESGAQPEQAIEAFGKAIAWQEKSAHPSEQPYVNLGNLLMEEGRLPEALEPLTKAVALAPDDAYCHLTLGVYYHKAGDLKSSQHELEQATRLDPDNAAAHYQLGRVYAEEHAVEKANAEFKRTDELKNQAANPKQPPPSR